MCEISMEEAILSINIRYPVTKTEEDVFNKMENTVKPYGVGIIKGKTQKPIYYEADHSLKLPDGRLKVLVQALSKARIKKTLQTKPCYRVELELVHEPELGEHSVKTEALMRAIREQMEKIMSLRSHLSADLMMVIKDRKAHV